MKMLWFVRTSYLRIVSKTVRYATFGAETRRPDLELYRLTALNTACLEDLTNILDFNLFPAEDVRKPPSVGLNLQDLYGEILPRCLNPEISRVCYDTWTKQAVGVIVNRFLGEKQSLVPQTIMSVCTGAKEIVRALQILENQSNFAARSATPGMQILYLGVLEPHRGKGIGGLLISDTLKTARDNGLAFLQTYTISSESRSFFSELGFNTLGELRLKKLNLDGSSAFPNATDDDVLSSMAKLLK